MPARFGSVSVGLSQQTLLEATMARLAPPVFDDHSEVAAVVYGGGEDPDALLAAFLRDLHRQGFDAVGIVQRHNPVHGGGAPVEFTLLPDDDRAGGDRAGGDRADGSQADGGWAVDPARPSDPLDACGRALQGVGQRLSALVEHRPDLVVLNRFGWQECNGSGLLDVLRLAIEREVPVVIAVPEALFARWLDLANGLAVKLPCDRRSLDRWWTALWRAPAPADRRPTACERYK